LTLDHLEDAQLIEEVGECTLFATIQVHMLTGPPGLSGPFPHLAVMSSLSFHEFPEGSKVRSAACHFAELLLMDIEHWADLFH